MQRREQVVTSHDPKYKGCSGLEQDSPVATTKALDGSGVRLCVATRLIEVGRVPRTVRTPPQNMVALVGGVPDHVLSSGGDIRGVHAFPVHRLGVNGSMSEFHVQVVQVGEIRKHPNADLLSITDVNGYPVIMRTGDFAQGDKAVYVPIDSIVPDEARWAFLKSKRHILAARLRGIFSMGLLTQADPSWEVGQNVQKELHIEKYEQPEPAEGNERDPGVEIKNRTKPTRGHWC